MGIIRKMALGIFLTSAIFATPLQARTNVSIGIGLPLFYPSSDFTDDRGYYRTHDNHYYHYERERNGWYYGRNHKEGLREEERRRKKEYKHQ